MKIERKNRTKLRDIEKGECFKNADGRIFMKTGGADSMRKIICVNLASGAVIWVDDDYSAVPIKIKAVEE